MAVVRLGDQPIEPRSCRFDDLNSVIAIASAQPRANRRTVRRSAWDGAGAACTIARRSRLPDAEPLGEWCVQRHFPFFLSLDFARSGTKAKLIVVTAVIADRTSPLTHNPVEHERHIVGGHLDDLAQTESAGFGNAFEVGNITHAPRWVARP